MYTIVATMSNYTATVIKTGNSYALRVPKSYIENAGLKIGDKVDIKLPQKQNPNERAKIQVFTRNRSLVY